MRLASAGLAPAVEIAIAIGPLRTIAGRMKLQSGGTSTTLHSIERRSASSKTAMLVSVSDVAAMARKRPSRSPGSNRRCVKLDVAGRGERAHLGARLGGDHVDVRVAGEQALDLLEADVSGPDDQAPAPGQLEAGDVERRLEHVGDAALIASLQPVLADARLAGVGLRWHRGMDRTGRPLAGPSPPVRSRACPTSAPKTSSSSAVMSANLLTASAGDALTEAARRMADRRVGAILVTDGDRADRHHDRARRAAGGRPGEHRRHGRRLDDARTRTRRPDARRSARRRR